jgi:hypothetical protein
MLLRYVRCQALAWISFLGLSLASQAVAGNASGLPVYTSNINKYPGFPVLVKRIELPIDGTRQSFKEAKTKAQQQAADTDAVALIYAAKTKLSVVYDAVKWGAPTPDLLKQVISYWPGMKGDEETNSVSYSYDYMFYSALKWMRDNKITSLYPHTEQSLGNNQIQYGKYSRDYARMMVSIGGKPYANTYPKLAKDIQHDATALIFLNAAINHNAATIPKLLAISLAHDRKDSLVAESAIAAAVKNISKDETYYDAWHTLMTKHSNPEVRVLAAKGLKKQSRGWMVGGAIYNEPVDDVKLQFHNIVLGND